MTQNAKKGWRKKGEVGGKKEQAGDRSGLSNKSGENVNGEARGKEKPCKSHEGSRQKNKKDFAGSSEKNDDADNERKEVVCVYVWVWYLAKPFLCNGFFFPYAPLKMLLFLQLHPG